jgi:hypothetical protein
MDYWMVIQTDIGNHVGQIRNIPFIVLGIDVNLFRAVTLSVLKDLSVKHL